MPKDRRPADLNNPLRAAGGALAPGVRLIGAGYALKRMLGRGGVSEVWLAWDRKLEKDVALKILPQSLLQDSDLVERLKAEAGRTKQLVHPAIAQVYDLVHDYESVALAMEYVDGWSLAALKVDRPQKRYLV